MHCSGQFIRKKIRRGMKLQWSFYLHERSICIFRTKSFDVLRHTIYHAPLYRPNVAISISSAGRSHSISLPSRLDVEMRVTPAPAFGEASCISVMARSWIVLMLSVSFLLSWPRAVLFLNSSRAALTPPAAGEFADDLESSLSRWQKKDQPPIMETN